MTCGEFVADLLHASTVAHIFHLRTKSYAKHVALAEFYEAIVDLADSFAETYQGQYGIMDDYPEALGMPTTEDPVEWIQALASDIREDRQELPQDTELQNILDEILALVEKTNYKLTNLE